MIDKIVHPSIIFSDVLQAAIDRKGKPKEFSLDTIPSIDDAIFGLRKGKLVIVAGRPSNGKSSFLISMAWSAVQQKKKILFFSLEMSNITCLERLLSYVCEIDNFQITTGQIADYYDAYSEKIAQLKAELDESHLILIESVGKTFKEITNLVHEHKPDMVFIDYLNLIRTSDKSQKRIAIDDYLDKLREFAIKMNFCCVVATQISRGSFDGSKVNYPMLKDLKESGGIEEKADMIFMCHYPFRYNHDEHINKFQLHLAKNRDGRCCVSECSYYPQYFKIIEDGVVHVKKEEDGTETKGIERKDWFN